MIISKIKEKCEWLADNNCHVSICYDAIPNYISNTVLPELKPSVWNEDWHYIGSDEDTLAYIIALDSINFGSGYFSCLKKPAGVSSGYVTVATALKNRFNQKPMTAKDLAELTIDDCALIFDQDITEPEIFDLMKMFKTALNETGEHIKHYYEGSFSKFVLSANKSVDKLVEQLSKIPNFKDISIYQNQEIPIYKRAQITAGDISTIFKNQGIGHFYDIGELTIFADNVVPHVLRYDGILQYSRDLVARIDKCEELKPHSDEEIALRACSIHAVEKIVEELHKTGHKNILTIDVDHWLWARGHETYYMDKKRHITKTIYY